MTPLESDAKIAIHDYIREMQRQDEERAARRRPWWFAVVASLGVSLLGTSIAGFYFLTQAAAEKEAKRHLEEFKNSALMQYLEDVQISTTERAFEVNKIN